MLLRQLVINRSLTEVCAHPQLMALLEDAGDHLQAAVRAVKHDATRKLDLETLAEIITAIKLLTNKDFRSVMTKDDVGINPNNAEELLKMLDSIPSDPTKALPSQAKSFIKAVASMSRSMKEKELVELKRLTAADEATRQHALASLQALTVKIDKAIRDLKKTAIK